MTRLFPPDCRRRAGFRLARQNFLAPVRALKNFNDDNRMKMHSI
ncbi:MAG: hypothetical protein AAF960_04055 [Bacteroidota bacterium]